MRRISLYGILLCLLCFAQDALAGKRYWVAGSAGNWNTTSSWSTTSGGSSGASVPGSSDTAYFNSGSTNNCTVDANVNIKRLDISSGYTGTISQGTYTITIGSTGATLSGGTFTGGSGSITSNGAFVISGTAFTSTSGTFTVAANYTLSSGSFTHNNGRVKFTATSTITGSTTFYKAEFYSTSALTYTIASGTTLTTNDTLFISGTAASTFNTGDISAKANIYVSNTGTSGGGGTATITINGTGNQSLRGASMSAGVSRICKLTINKSSGTLTITNRIVEAGGAWIWTSGSISSSGSIVGFSASATITGSHTLSNVAFGTSTYTIASGTTLTVTDSVDFSGTTAAILNTGTLAVQGDIVNAQTATSAGGGTATILFSGSSDQYVYGTSTYGTSRYCNIQINKTGGTLYLNNYITALGNWTYTAGTVNPGSSVVIMASTKTISGSMSFYGLHFDGSVATTYTISTGSSLTVNNKLAYLGTANITLNTGNIHSRGDIEILNTGTGGGGSATIYINGTGSSYEHKLTGSGTSGAGRLPNVVVQDTAYKFYLESIISVSGNWTYVSGSIEPGSSSVAFFGTTNIDGKNDGGTTMSFYKVAFAGTHTLTGDIKSTSNTSVSSGGTLNAGNYTVTVGGNWIDNGTFNTGTSTVVLNGSSYNTASKSGGAQESFYNLTLNRSSGSHTLTSPAKVSNTLTLTKGKLKTTTTNYLEIADNATLSGGSDSAYVHGPVRKTGNDAFTFPLGDTTLGTGAYHPLGITAPSVSTDKFEATYFAANPQTVYGTSKVDSLENVSSCEYWFLDRKNGSSNVTTSLSWNTNLCNSDNFSDLRVGNWNGSQWLDAGAASRSVSGNIGTVTALSLVTFTSNQAALTISKHKTFSPYAILKKKLDAGFYQCIDGKLMFRYDEEYTPSHDDLTFRIYDDANTLVTSNTLNLYPANLKPVVRYGDNRYLINTADCRIAPTGFLTNGFYILEVVNDKNEHWYLRFKNTNSITVINCNTGGFGE